MNIIPSTKIIAKSIETEEDLFTLVSEVSSNLEQHLCDIMNNIIDIYSHKIKLYELSHVNPKEKLNKNMNLNLFESLVVQTKTFLLNQILLYSSFELKEDVNNKDTLSSKLANAHLLYIEKCIQDQQLETYGYTKKSAQLIKKDLNYYSLTDIEINKLFEYKTSSAILVKNGLTDKEKTILSHKKSIGIKSSSFDDYPKTYTLSNTNIDYQYKAIYIVFSNLYNKRFDKNFFYKNFVFSNCCLHAFDKEPSKSVITWDDIANACPHENLYYLNFLNFKFIISDNIFTRADTSLSSLIKNEKNNSNSRSGMFIKYTKDINIINGILQIIMHKNIKSTEFYVTKHLFERIYHTTFFSSFNSDFIQKLCNQINLNSVYDFVKQYFESNKKDSLDILKNYSPTKTDLFYLSLLQLLLFFNIDATDFLNSDNPPFTLKIENKVHTFTNKYGKQIHLQKKDSTVSSDSHDYLLEEPYIHLIIIPHIIHDFLSECISYDFKEDIANFITKKESNSIQIMIDYNFFHKSKQASNHYICTLFDSYYQINKKLDLSPFISGLTEEIEKNSLSKNNLLKQLDWDAMTSNLSKNNFNLIPYLIKTSARLL
ncbi:hypothetical protein [Faecalitalea cylindroides]|uniref:hypothetical protein n=1 Tax=Faecalitalea cylindroides TaxID=39483 RepID=UPI00267533DC|nr:hypothetical protein [Faecalitalea cylindroides]